MSLLDNINEIEQEEKTPVKKTDKNYIGLHVHTVFSFLDGYNKIDRLVNRVKELGMKAVAITDHGYLAGVPQFQDECKKQGVKPLLGLEGYYTPVMSEMAKDSKVRRADAQKKAMAAGALTESDMEDFKKKKRPQKELTEIIKPFMYDMTGYHILFIAKNQTGWSNLVKIQSESARLCTFNGRPHCDMELLRKYHEGLICTCACISSYPAQMITDGHEEKALEYINSMLEIFGKEDFYLEIQPLNIKRQRQVNLKYMELAKEFNIKCVATNDSHWTYKEDYDDHDTLLCIGTGAKKADNARMHYSNDFWMKSYEEMLETFEKQSKDMPKEEKLFSLDGKDKEYEAFYLEALEETNRVANKVEDSIKLGSNVDLFSKVKVPGNLSAEEYLRVLAYHGLYEYLKKNPQLDRAVYEKRLFDELNIINPKGYAPYMLAVKEYVTWANEHGCPTGPGRGSAAGSLCLFCIGVTKNIDPIQNQLWFSRFLTKDRTTPPDIDCDFAWSHRDDVIHHLEDYYGIEKVAHIGTFGTMGVKSGLKDICRVLSIPFEESNSISKELDDICKDGGLAANECKFKKLDALAEGDDKEKAAYKRFHELEERYAEAFRLCRAFEGIPRNMGVHASGVLVTPMPVTDLFPVRYVDGTAVTLYEGPRLEELKAIKYDILGLKTLDIIQWTLKAIDENMTMDDLYEKVDVNDPKVFDTICKKQTEAVFQIESDMMKGIIDMIQPTDFNDIGAINALGRPGPLAAGMPKDYGDRKNGKAEISYPIRGCEDILDITYGCIPYQEQLMAISKKIAGFDDGQADSLTRKTIAKKKVKMMPMLIRCHIFGKKNCEGPEGWENDDHAPWYDPEGHYGGEIEGAVNRGYTEEEVRHYFKVIEKFSSYCFNKSHSQCYAYIAILTAWLKTYYPAEFMAAALTMADEDSRKLYSQVCEQQMSIPIQTPDVNISGQHFTASNGAILYGLEAIKGVGASAIPEIIAHRPYASVSEAVAKIPKKAFNKKVSEALIQAGAFDFEDTNRYTLLNELGRATHCVFDSRDTEFVAWLDDMIPEENENDSPVSTDYRQMLKKAQRRRKEPEIEELEEETWSPARCIECEEKFLGTPITFKPWWDTIQVDENITVTAELKSVREHVDKKGRLMAFVQMTANNCDFEGVCFASRYSKYVGLFDTNYTKYVTLRGKKSSKGSLIINSAESADLEETA